MSNTEKIQGLIDDILINHLPKVKESLETGYIDENQALIVFDHMVRIRTLRDIELTNK